MGQPGVTGTPEASWLTPEQSVNTTLATLPAGWSPLLRELGRWTGTLIAPDDAGQQLHLDVRRSGFIQARDRAGWSELTLHPEARTAPQLRRLIWADDTPDLIASAHLGDFSWPEWPEAALQQLRGQARRIAGHTDAALEVLLRRARSGPERPDLLRLGLHLSAHGHTDYVPLTQAWADGGLSLQALIREQLKPHEGTGPDHDRAHLPARHQSRVRLAPEHLNVSGGQLCPGDITELPERSVRGLGALHRFLRPLLPGAAPALLRALKHWQLRPQQTLQLRLSRPGSVHAVQLTPDGSHLRLSAQHTITHQRSWTRGEWTETRQLTQTLILLPPRG